MTWSRRSRAITIATIAVVVGAVGGWALSRSSDGVDANLTTPGIDTYPTIGTNANNDGRAFDFVEIEAIDGSGTTTIDGSGRNLVVNFWFSTCGPCKREMPALAAAAGRYAGKVEFIGVNPNDTAESANAFLRRYGVDYPNYLDDGDQLAAAGVTTMPATFFVRNGRIVETHAGELSPEEIDDIISRVFGVVS